MSRSAKGLSSVCGRSWVCDCVGICSVVGEGEGEESVDELQSKQSCFARVLSTQIVPPEKRFERRGYLRSEERLVSNCCSSGYGSQSVRDGECAFCGLWGSSLSSCE